MSLYSLSLLLPSLILQASAQSYSNVYGNYTVTQDTGGDVPLVDKSFPYPDFPYQADTGTGPRGTQQGYNICNSTTAGPNSWCQTAFVNSISDFCIWGSPVTGQTVGDIEEEMVSYCTSSKYGGRVLSAGALTGVYAVRTPDYLEIVGFIDQTTVGLPANDTGGEEDPHGADSRGNPLGSLMYSSAFLATNPSAKDYVQVKEWNYFIGSGIFCMKVCDPASANAAQMCQHTYDEVGCTYNMPANYGTINGTFEQCLGDDQLPVGEYVVNGVTSTWAQSEGFTTVPYQPSVPPSSSCTTYSSAQLYTALMTTTTTTTTTSKSSSTEGPSRSSTTHLTTGTPAPSGSNTGGSKNGAGSVRVGSGMGGVWGMMGAGVTALLVGGLAVL